MDKDIKVKFIPAINIMVTGARAPVALHLCRLLAQNGNKVFLADTYKSPLSAASNLHSGYFQLPSPRFNLLGYSNALARIVEQNNIDLIIPTCEEVFYLAILADRGLLDAKLFSPDISLLTQVHNKYEFIKLVRGFGLATPETQLISSAHELGAVRADHGQLVFKPVWSRFSSEVLIRPSERMLKKISPTKTTPWVAQEFVEGEELSVYAIARNGQMVACAIYRSLFRAGKGAGVCFKPVEDQAISAWVTEFIQKSAWNGQVSFDMVRQGDGTAMPLECNPRATSGLHFFADPEAFSAAVWQSQAVAPDVSQIQASRLAMWVYGLPAAVRARKLRAFRNTLRDANEILAWSGDNAPVKAQFRALAEIAGIALRQRISLQQASTRDIEWNGPDQSSIL